MPEMFIFLSLFLGLFLLVWGYFCLKAEASVRKKIRPIWLIFMVIFIVVMWLGRRSPQQAIDERPRISFLPLADFSYNDDYAWLTYFLVEEANQTLQSALAREFRVIPQHWLWQCLDADSVMSTSYLEDFSRRIKLNYAVIGSISYEKEETAIDYLLFKFPEGNLLQKARTSAPVHQRSTLGKKWGEEIILFLKPNIAITNRAKTYPEPFIAHRVFAQKHLAMRHFPQAIHHAALALALDSTDVTTRNVYAEALILKALRDRKLGIQSDADLQLALQLCEGTILRHGENAESYRLLAKYYLTEKIYSKAEELLIKSLSIEPDNPAALVDFTYLHPSRYHKIRFKNEEQILRRALAINPCCEQARLPLADYYYYRHNTARAKATIEELLAIHPRSIDGLMYLGKLAMEKEAFDDFRNIYDKLLQIDPRHPEIFYNLGIYYYHLQDFEQAKEFFHRAVRLGNHLDSHLYLGYIYEKKGLIPQAISEYGLRIRGRQGADDEFAEEARKRLRLLTKPDSGLFHANEF